MGKSNNKKIDKMYSKLTDSERIDLVILASKRDDREEVRRLMAGGEIKEEQAPEEIDMDLSVLEVPHLSLIVILTDDTITDEERVKLMDEVILERAKQLEKQKQLQTTEAQTTKEGVI